MAPTPNHRRGDEHPGERHHDHHPNHHEPPGERRTLSDADVSAIVAQLRKEVVEDFYLDIGRGVWAMVQRVFIVALLAVAAYGFYHQK